MMVTTSILQLVLFACIGTKFVHDIATIITDQCDIYLCSYGGVCSCRPYPDPHNITYICVMVAILVVIIVLVPMDK